MRRPYNIATSSLIRQFNHNSFYVVGGLLLHSVKLEFANESHLLAEQEEALPIGEEGN